MNTATKQISNNSNYIDYKYFVNMNGTIYGNGLPSGKVKVKVTLVQALRVCTGRTTHIGSRGIALLFHDQRH